jgi:hypothetical protein
MRRESSTVVVVVGEVQDVLLDEVARFPNVAVARPPQGDAGSFEAAAEALRQASRGIAPYVLVPADPLAAVAAEWRAMWDLTQGPRGAAGFEQRAAEALAAWRAGRFELPDYYLDLVGPVLTNPVVSGPVARGPVASSPVIDGHGAGHTEAANTRAADHRAANARATDAGPDFYLGPLRAARPRRVAAAMPADGSQQATQVLDALRSLPHGPWWPPLDELIDTARHFFAGALSGGPGTLRS